MPAFSNNLDLEQMTENQDGAEVVHNDSNSKLDAALTEWLEIDVGSGNYSITDLEWRTHVEFKVINAGGASPNREITVPAIKRLVLIWSDPTNTDSIDIVRGATRVTIEAGGAAFIRADGTTDGLFGFNIGGAGGGGFGDFLSLTETGLQTVAGPVTFAAPDVLSVTIGTALTDRIITFAHGSNNTIKLSSPAAVNEVLQPLLETGGSCGYLARRFANNATSFPFNLCSKARGTLDTPSDSLVNDELGAYSCGGYGAGFRTGITYGGIVIAATPSGTDFQSRAVIKITPAGSVTAAEFWSIDTTSGMRISSQVVIDANRILRTRSTTLGGLFTSSAAGKIAHASDTNGGIGSFMMDTGGGYREVGSTGVKRLGNSDATHTPVADARFVRDVGALSADRKYTLAVTNVLNGYWVQVSRNGGSGGFLRKVYQADGTTLIKDLADNTYGVFVWDSIAALWYLAATGACN